MASVFTFDPDLPKLSSPWPTKPVSDSVHTIGEPRAVLAGGGTAPVSDLAELGVTRLEAEPQDGPTEYKLHLLLRPRQSFSALSTVHHASGPHPLKCGVQQGETQSELKHSRQPLGPTPNSQSRQNRLEHLTTQLLWRLQQSSPYHSSSKSALIVPVLPQTEVNLHLRGPDKLLPGLEESQGALYEIGVSDNGSFVGLTEEELDESLSTLRAMAFSLGCKVEVLRMVLVGNCKWTENTSELNGNAAAGVDHTENLWVAEALVTPNHEHASHTIAAGSSDSDTSPRSQGVANLQRIETEKRESQTEQLRVLLIGTADVGKSSLLGTLSTSTLDNGRGMIRVSSLKHPHEIISGVTSSLTSELIGYHITSRPGTDEISSTEVINYASGNVSTWIDIHNASEPGRLVFFTDTPGRLKYRHSTLRGLVSWAPHWAVCCVAASGEDRKDSSLGACLSAQDSHSAQGNGVDTSRANLILCLKLNLPTVIVITKLDLVSSKKILEETLRKILSIVKSSGRQPRLLVSPSDCNQDPQFRTFAKENEYKVLQKMCPVPEEGIGNLVPIVLTSAVRGDGIGMLHALLRHLPIPCTVEASSSRDGQSDSRRPAVLFHIDEFYTPADGHPQTGFNGSKGTRGLVLGGHLRYGTLMIGDELLVGPFTAVEDSLKKVIARTKSFPGQVGQISQGLRKLALSCDEQRPSSADDRVTNHIGNVSSHCHHSAPVWQKIYVTSLRNLRLPVRKLLAGQFGTVGISSSSSDVDETKGDLSSCRVRRGMVLIKSLNKSNKAQPVVYRLFSAIFDDANSGGRMIARMQVTVYIASIKAAAKILTVQAQSEAQAESRCLDEFFLSPDNNNNYSDKDGGVVATASKPVLKREVTFQFVSSREWVEIGTQVLVMPAAGSGTGRSEGGDSAIASLEGFVGKITEAME